MVAKRNTIIGKRQNSQDELADTGAASMPVSPTDSKGRRRNPQERIEMIKLLHSSRKKKGRMARLLQLRKDDFERLPLNERAALQQAFLNSNHGSAGTLSGKGVRHALKELGLYAKTVNERKELRLLCEEVAVVRADFLLFCFEAVPRARELLRELRHGPLLQDFMFYDADRSGMLDLEECLPMIERLYNWNLDAEGVRMLRESFALIFAEEAARRILLVKPAMPVVDEVDFDGFECMINRLQERHQQILLERERDIREEEALGDEDNEHDGEIPMFFRAFAREASQGDEQHRRASPEDLNRILLDFGMLPQSEDGLVFLRDVIAQSASLGSEVFKLGEAAADLSFRQFMHLLDRMRGWWERKRFQEMKEAFAKQDKEGRGCLNMTEVNVLVGDLGLVARSKEHQEILKTALIQVDEEGSGEVPFDEFQVLVQRITERMAAVQSKREREAGAEAGFNAQEVVELRDAFHMLSADGPKILRIEELRRAVDLTRSKTRRAVDSDELHELLQRFDAGKVGGLSFEQFVRFMRAVLDRSA